MRYRKRLFEIIQASTEHDLASKVFDICLIVLVRPCHKNCVNGRG